MDLNTIWFILVGVLIIGYAILDGFDLGVGILSLFARNEDERRVHLNAIGPFWDGNEVWLLTAGGALFAAFPEVYATVFSGFYIAFMLLLVALIFRAVSIEFYHQVDSASWRTVWGLAFGIGSLLPAILTGVAFGNILHGIPLDAHREFTGSFFTLLNPYALLIGILSLAWFVMHGATYMAVKTDGDLQRRMAGCAQRAWDAFTGLYVLATIFSVIACKHLFSGLLGKWPFYVVFIALIVAIPAFRSALRAGKYLAAFVASSGIMAAMVGLSGVSLFPRLVPASTDLALSLTAYNASSTPRTLGVMLIVALIGVPLVLAYTAYVYWVFRGKADASHSTY